MWGWVPGGGTIGTARWAAGKAKGRPRNAGRKTFWDDFIAFAEEVEREDAKQQRKAKTKTYKGRQG